MKCIIFSNSKLDYRMTVKENSDGSFVIIGDDMGFSDYESLMAFTTANGWVVEEVTHQRTAKESF